MYRSRLFNRFLLLVIAALMMAGTPNLTASAALLRCRTDPIFQLSNGDKITITLDVNTADTNIRNVTYVLHVPAGVTVTRVTYTAGGLGTKELYRVYQDSTAKTYKTESLATTQNTGSVAMVATVKLNSLTAKSASGYTGQYIIVTVGQP